MFEEELVIVISPYQNKSVAKNGTIIYLYLFISVIDANLVYHNAKDNQKAIQPVGPQRPEGPMLPAGPTSPDAPIAPVGPTEPGWLPPQGPATQGWMGQHN